MRKVIGDRALKICLLCLAGLLAIIVLPIFTAAQSPIQLEFRINQLESQIADLRGQVYRLNSQGSGVTRPGTPSRPNSTQENLRRSGDPMFDNLANLAIETKQDVQKIQERLSKLEAAIKR
ncbi:MAG: hypothetical protein MUE44_25625 [Oscillatoriaceae cyanobacterium Prado104]|jgi:prefoldin subunit 5|nr:hypothetical protein [Oscillatoriaceae cyanobacterium Prado104]